MKQLFRRLLTFSLAVMLVLCCTATAFATETTVTWQGQEKGFGFAPGSEYTTTDLFGSFKGIMPGDKRTQTITLNNVATDSDYVRFYLRAVPHGSDNFPQTETETIATMQEFLSKLSMRVYNGDTLIFDAAADQTASLTENVFLAQLASKSNLALKVELEVPISLDNHYAGRIGEVDWVFTAEEFGDPETVTVKKVWSDNGKNRPTSVTVALYNGETKVETVTLSASNNWTYTWQELDGLGDWSVKEINVPKGYKATYKVKGEITTITNTASLIQTGQLNWPIPVLADIGFMLLTVGLFLIFGKRKRDRD